ncbi:MAG TPA: hypothetical protein VF007_04605 [Stellaceae bacterium]
MQDDRIPPAFEALRRKLRALAAVARNAGATPAERANAAALKKQIERRLRDAGAPTGGWSDHAFRLGRRLGAMRKSGVAAAGEADLTDHARRLGKAFGRAYRKWTSE